MRVAVRGIARVDQLLGGIYPASIRDDMQENRRIVARLRFRSAVDVEHRLRELMIKALHRMFL